MPFLNLPDYLNDIRSNLGVDVQVDYVVDVDFERKVGGALGSRDE